MGSGSGHPAPALMPPRIRRSLRNSAADLWVFWRSLLPFLACIYRTLFDHEIYNMRVGSGIVFIKAYSCNTAVRPCHIFPVRPCHVFSYTAMSRIFPVRPCHGFFTARTCHVFSCTAVSRGVYTHTGLFSHSSPPLTEMDRSRQTGWSVAYRCVRLFTVISEKSTAPAILRVTESLDPACPTPPSKSAWSCWSRHISRVARCRRAAARASIITLTATDGAFLWGLTPPSTRARCDTWPPEAPLPMASLPTHLAPTTSLCSTSLCCGASRDDNVIQFCSTTPSLFAFAAHATFAG